MSLYYDASSIFSSTTAGGSLKSRVYGSASKLKSKPAHIYALICETAKYDGFLKEVIENAGILALEPKVTPLLSLFLVHDHLLSKGGIAAPSSHPLRQAIERHKARIHAEFTKSRLRRKCATVDKLKSQLRDEAKKDLKAMQPRWVRVNRLRGSVDKQLETTFAGFKRTTYLSDVVAAPPGDRVLYIDAHIPDLLAIPPGFDVTRLQAYKNGEVILQDKASCFPAYLLLGSDQGDGENVGHIIDACAAPGNKTTHLASILAGRSSLKGSRGSKIYACERDAARSKILQKMVNLASADQVVTVLPQQDFLALDTEDKRFENVTHLLLDPSCSGSGIVGREDIPTLALPKPAYQAHQQQHDRKHPKKRKRDEIEERTPGVGLFAAEQELAEEEGSAHPIDPHRIEKLSNLQTRIIEHAFAFPAARYITYSTCSINIEENEKVVSRVLHSKPAKERGWHILNRNEQVEGLKRWKHRGIRFEVSDGAKSLLKSQNLNVANVPLNEQESQACLRATSGAEDGTMGFFVCGFVRDPASPETITGRSDTMRQEDEQEAWEGFSNAS